jgi:hypothetical protein
LWRAIVARLAGGMRRSPRWRHAVGTRTGEFSSYDADGGARPWCEWGIDHHGPCPR